MRCTVSHRLCKVSRPALSSSPVCSSQRRRKSSELPSALQKARSRSTEQHLQFDREHIWHPYTSLKDPTPVLAVSHAQGTRLVLEDGTELLDGMSSWWACIWGYNHPVLNDAVEVQLKKMSHVMFGGLTHRPAMELTSVLLELVQHKCGMSDLSKVFFTDSGSVAVEVALKMAIQYWRGIGFAKKTKMCSVRGGYHGDTFGAMSVCDPIGGMHSAFANGMLAKQIFTTRPPCDVEFAMKTDDSLYSASLPQGCKGCTCNGGESFQDSNQSAMYDLECILEQHHESLAALILEPIVQGAGGMRFYSPVYLQRARQLCDDYNVLLICDEIATGFGRSGNYALFASQEAKVMPDILCLGKALTGGYMTLGAVLTSERIANGVSSSPSSSSEAALPLMHGPTFMANPLACSVAVASLSLMLQHEPNLDHVPRISQQLQNNLQRACTFSSVAAVRVRGAIGVIELKEPLTDPLWVLQQCRQAGVWLRPFGRLLYTMPPYIMSNSELEEVCNAMLMIAASDKTMLNKV